jgi:hypothetical protein
VRTFIARGERARELHAEASVRLDAADYALQRLMSDLGPVLGLPRRPAPLLAVARQGRRAAPAVEAPLAA